MSKLNIEKLEKKQNTVTTLMDTTLRYPLWEMSLIMQHTVLVVDILLNGGLY